ncbi:hypothetical protein L6164_002322 [Bauhinia variegata]|uniref:Uncharacterized protein n=1 Tax=Bauhinia variegata TaxID=167791 RepID=A0ACB9PZB0_BAUVA|nr:hypothetical protein L6164_002322 [Bauhinia variegata]
MMECQTWPEPVIRVSALAQSGLTKIPQRFVKPHSQRASMSSTAPHQNGVNGGGDVNIPVIDLQHLSGGDQRLREETLRRVSVACREYGFFQVLNHGVSHELMRSAREVWREFFNLPVEVKEEYANSPTTYEGYGSRLGVKKGAILDWSDYFFLHYMPASLRNPAKWPSLPPSCRQVIAEYGEQVVKLGDPGGMTILLPDEDVSGLQVRRGDDWITVKPVPNAFIINIGDQIQVLSNAIYKSVEHRVIVNSNKDRVSLAFFYNPRSDLLIQPTKELVTEETPALYPPMTFDEYRLYIRTKGPCGKSQVEALKSPSFK